jgi:hypothetical protein
MSAASPCAAQGGAIPGRDLLAFPLAQTAETGALATVSGSALWNPAASVLGDSVRWRLSAAAMNAPADVAVAAQVGSVGVRTWRGFTLGLTVAAAGVDGLARTQSDPQSVGPDITYATLVTSLVAAKQISPRLTAGLALRRRTGRLEDVRRSGTSLDLGVIATLAPADLRVGAATFLLSPGGPASDRASYLVGWDARVLGSDSTRAVRAGYGFEAIDGLSREQVFFASARYRTWELRGGPVHTAIYGITNWRLRLGVAVRHAGYTVGVAREESAGGLAPTYQFSLSAVLR